MRIRWQERSSRPEWDILYTVIGGRLADDLLSSLPERLATPVGRAVSQAFVAARRAVRTPRSDITYWATVVRKITQRGTRPVLTHPKAAVLELGIDLPQDRILAAIAGPPGEVELDPSFELHPTYERPFWNRWSQGG